MKVQRGVAAFRFLLLIWLVKKFKKIAFDSCSLEIDGSLPSHQLGVAEECKGVSKSWKVGGNLQTCNPKIYADLLILIRFHS